jgi:hypothetical protein
MDKFALRLAENPKDTKPVVVVVVVAAAAVASAKSLPASALCYATTPSTLPSCKKKSTCCENCEDMTMSFGYMTCFAWTMNSL